MRNRPVMRPLSLVTYDVLLRTGNPWMGDEMPMAEMVDCRSWIVDEEICSCSSIHDPQAPIFDLSPDLLRHVHPRRATSPVF